MPGPRSFSGLRLLPGLGLCFLFLVSPSLRAENWPSFRGQGARGVAGGTGTVRQWNVQTGSHLLWKRAIPGLGLSSPVIWQDSIFLSTARGKKKAGLKVGLYGSVESVEDEGTLEWLLLCLDRISGKVRWRRLVHRARPKVRRHPKSSHANATPATDGTCVVVFLGSEGLHCFDMNGELRWKKDLGLLDWGWYVRPSAQWGGGSSPILYKDLVIVQCDVQGNSFLAAFSTKDGTPRWRTAREEVPTWCTPTIAAAGSGDQLVVNGYRHMGGYDPLTGKEIWRLAGGGDIPVPTPVAGQGLIFLTSAHGRLSPIYAVRPTAKGDITLEEGKTKNDHIAWSIRRGGNYMQTPIVVGEHLYCCRDSGVLSCFTAMTGERHYRERLGELGEGFTASPVSSGEAVYFASERGNVYVVKAGPGFERLAVNAVGEAVMATPAIAHGVLFIRGRHHLFALGKKMQDEDKSKK